MAHKDSTDKVRPAPSFTVKLRNPTQRTIKIDRTCVLDAKKTTYVVPSHWTTVSEVPSHDQRSFVVSVTELQSWAKSVKMVQPEKGRFIIVDALNNESKTTKLGDLLSLAHVPAAKLP